MASIKRLKKDIDYLTFSVIGDCYNYSMTTGKNNPEVSEIIKDILMLRNDLRDRINAAGKIEGKKEKKAYYHAIFNDLFVNVDKAFTRLSETVKNN